VSAEDKKTVLDAVKEAMEWVEENAEADADEFNDRRKEVSEGSGVRISY
jgi:molecular chaperone DnaK (HSP70)